MFSIHAHNTLYNDIVSTVYRLFGTPEITQDIGMLSPLMQSQKGVALVTFLIVTNRPYSRESLADLFWEATSTSQVLHNLRSLFTRIRPLVPELNITRTTISFNASPDTDVDYLTLKSVLDEDITDIETIRLDAALEIYRDDLLANFYLQNASRFEEWLVLERERIRQRVFNPYRRLCKSYLAAEQWAAIDKIVDFTAQVNELVLDSILTPEQAQPLLDAVERIITAIEAT